MPETPIFKFPTPDGSESNDIEQHLLALAQRIEAQMDMLWPVGVVYPFLVRGSTPEGFLVCAGQSVSAIRYPRLAALLGNVVDDKFTLPNLMGVILRGHEGGQEIGGEIGSDQISLSTAQLPSHVHGSGGLSIVGNHYHNPGSSEFVITQPTPQNHAIQMFNGGGGPGNVQVTFTKNEPMDNSSMDVGGSTDNAGGGQPVPIIPKSRIVRWITRGA